MVTAVSISLGCLYNTRSILWSSPDVDVLGTLLGIVFVSPLRVPRNCYSLLDCLIFSIRFLLFYEMGLWCSVSHMVACSVFYKANVIGDHDTSVEV